MYTEPKRLELAKARREQRRQPKSDGTQAEQRMYVWLPLLSGFIGAVIGAAASIITVTVQARH